MEEEKTFYCPNGHEYEDGGLWSDGDGDLYQMYHCYKCGYKARHVIEAGCSNFYDGEFYEEYDEELFLEAARREIALEELRDTHAMHRETVVSRPAHPNNRQTPIGGQ